MTIKIYTDGSSRGNPGPGGFGAIIFYEGKVVELGGFEDMTTNNRMELKASIEALNYINGLSVGAHKVQIHTDSKYLLKGITEWIFNWQRNGWMTKNNEQVLNADLWQELFAVSQGLNIEWTHVSGHSGILFNERADEIATSFALKADIKLFEGQESNYRIIKKPSVSKKGKAYSYISLVDGAVETHKSWVECEKRVKGKKGARFKKTSSSQDEEEVKKKFESLK